MEIDRANWSGEGDLTQAVLDALAGIEQIACVRVEDAPAGRAGAGFSFIANEVFVGFRIARTIAARRLLGVVPLPVIGTRKSLTLEDLEARLARVPAIGPADYSDAGMLQYLRAERIIPAYQSRGPKVVEMLRVYEMLPSAPRSSAGRH